MAAEPEELGTLVVVVARARNLPNKTFKKQDPYVVMTIDSETFRTDPVKRGGQHPEWDAELRFGIFPNADDLLANGSGKDLPAVPNKPGVVTPSTMAKASRNKGKKGPGKTLKAKCYADAGKEPELIGEVDIPIDDVLVKGEVDEWYELKAKGKYAGELYLEFTFYSNAAPPVPPSPLKPVRPGMPTSVSVTGMNLYIPPYSSRPPQAGGIPHSTSLQPGSGGLTHSSSFQDLGLPPQPTGHTPGQRPAGQHGRNPSVAGADALAGQMGSMSLGPSSRPGANHHRHSFNGRPQPPTQPPSNGSTGPKPPWAPLVQPQQQSSVPIPGRPATTSDMHDARRHSASYQSPQHRRTNSTVLELPGGYVQPQRQSSPLPMDPRRSPSPMPSQQQPYQPPPRVPSPYAPPVQAPQSPPTPQPPQPAYPVQPPSQQPYPPRTQSYPPVPPLQSPPTPQPPFSPPIQSYAPQAPPQQQPGQPFSPPAQQPQYPDYGGYQHQTQQAQPPAHPQQPPAVQSPPLTNTGQYDPWATQPPQPAPTSSSYPQYPPNSNTTNAPPAPPPRVGHGQGYYPSDEQYLLAQNQQQQQQQQQQQPGYGQQAQQPYGYQQQPPGGFTSPPPPPQPATQYTAAPQQGYYGHDYNSRPAPAPPTDAAPWGQPQQPPQPQFPPSQSPVNNAAWSRQGSAQFTPSQFSNGQPPRGVRRGNSIGRDYLRSIGPSVDTVPPPPVPQQPQMYQQQPNQMYQQQPPNPPPNQMYQQPQQNQPPDWYTPPPNVPNMGAY